VIKPSDEPDLEYQKKQKDCQITSGLWWLGDPPEKSERSLLKSEKKGYSILLIRKAELINFN